MASHGSHHSWSGSDLGFYSSAQGSITEFSALLAQSQENVQDSVQSMLGNFATLAAITSQSYTNMSAASNSCTGIINDDLAAMGKAAEDHMSQVVAGINQETEAREKSAAKANQQKSAQNKGNEKKKTLPEFEKETSDFFQPVEKSFSSSVLNIIKGTQTLHASVVKLLSSLLETSISTISQIGAKWLTNNFAEIASNNQLLSSIFGIADAHQAASAASMVTITAETHASILNSAAKGAAAAYASTTEIPMIGPSLAPAAAIKAYSEIMAFNLTSAAGGYDVPADTFALIHKREMVLPAVLADRVRAMTTPAATVSSGSVSVHIQAVDAHSVKRLFKNNGNALIQPLRTLMRNGAAIRT